MSISRTAAVATLLSHTACQIGCGGDLFQISLDQEIPEIEPPPETEYVKHERLQSDLLTEFWGRPVLSRIVRLA